MIKYFPHLKKLNENVLNFHPKSAWSACIENNTNKYFFGEYGGATYPSSKDKCS